MDKEYKITSVVPRDPWTGKYGTFNSYALNLEGFEGWVQINQMQKNKDGSDKPAPQVGEVVFGSIKTETKGDKTFFSFKKANKDYKGGGGNNTTSSKDIEYIIMMLEELTLRRESPEEPKPRDEQKTDVVPSDDDGTKPFSLSDIPF